MIELRPFDAAEHLKGPSEVAMYVEAVLIDGDAVEISDALDVAARALGRSEPHLRPGADLETLVRALEALGLDLRLAVRPVAA